MIQMQCECIVAPTWYRGCICTHSWDRTQCALKEFQGRLIHVASRIHICLCTRWVEMGGG